MPSMRRLLPAITVLSLFALPAAGSQAASVGISDQQASAFSSPFYKPLKLKYARYITPFDVMKDGFYHRKLDQWLIAAKGQNQRILIAFEHSYRKGRQKHAPSGKEYTSAMKSFHKAYPERKDARAWKGATQSQRPLPNNTGVGQPICHNPKRA